MKANETLNKFGKFLVENLRDSGINFLEGLLSSHWKSKESIILQTDLQSFTDKQKNIVRQVVVRVIDRAIHDFLFAVSEQVDFDNDIQIKVDKKNIVDISDGLAGEIYGEDGWFTKFSKYEK